MKTIVPIEFFSYLLGGFDDWRLLQILQVSDITPPGIQSGSSDCRPTRYRVGHLLGKYSVIKTDNTLDNPQQLVAGGQHQDSRVSISLVGIGDGLTLAVKRGDG
ncbi:MAG: hypothetical protein AAFO87_03700 [Cyanobacteria bacterium J06607_6]